MQRWVRAVTVCVSCVCLVVAASGTGLAATAEAGSRPAAELADRNHDRISDDLGAELSHRRNGDKLAVVVTYAGRGNATSAQKAVGAFHVKREYSIIRGFAATMTTAQIRALSKRSEVFRIDSDFVLRTTNDSANRDFGTAAARSTYGVTGAGIGICVVDTGVDQAHEQMNSKAPIPFVDMINGQTTAYDDHGHGSHVATTAAGDGTGGANAATFAGVAPAAKILAAKVLGRDGSGPDSGVLSGVEWCASRSDVHVISMSLGGDVASDGQDSLSQAVNNAVAAGKVAVIAAGNSGDDRYTVPSPGAATGAITVGAAAEWSAPAGTDRRSLGAYLAHFSSRGPTLDGRVKPDVVGPGVTIRSAAAGTSNGYTTLSGTSMATPFVAGTAVLALSANPTLNPAGIRSLLEGTAHDRGTAGKDNDWGAGLVDGLAVVAGASGSSGTNGFPTNTTVAGTVPNNGTWTYNFGVRDTSVPIAATIIIDGHICDWADGCFWPQWLPDLDAQLLNPSGQVISESICAAGAECGIGRQEILHAVPATTGTYTVKVFAYGGEPNYGQGGTFVMDLSHGPVIGTPPPPPPSPPGTVQVHSGDLDRSAVNNKKNWTAKATVTVHDSTEALVAGATVAFSWSGGASGSGTCVTNASGTCTVSVTLPNKKTSVTFTITNITGSSMSYLSSANHDADGDSNGGTSITVTKP